MIKSTNDTGYDRNNNDNINDNSNYIYCSSYYYVIIFLTRITEILFVLNCLFSFAADGVLYVIYSINAFLDFCGN
ncbi:Hypothetical predicted protein [Octopus vulgaris]|uniref:Uncharacterized protein n=1 Tax=Octopus vulgaris TaxID=6645 RepID=A0AA36FGS0_OCTVU|nr:Hypothetical predicted protein [Octopus vulgaris]